VTLQSPYHEVTVQRLMDETELLHGANDWSAVEALGDIAQSDVPAHKRENSFTARPINARDMVVKWLYIQLLTACIGKRK